MLLRNILSLKILCKSSFLCKMRLCCLISLKISGLNVVTYGMMSDSFDFSGFFNKHVLSSNFTFSMASSISFNGYFRFLIHPNVEVVLHFQIQ